MTTTKQISKLARDFQRLEFTAKVAERSTIKTFSTGALIVGSDEAFISHGWSHYGEVIQRRYQHLRSVHAELHAILRSPRRDLLVGSTIYVVTIRNKSKNHNWGCGKPCEFCEQLIHDVGIKRVVYTTGENGHEFDEYRP